jgi:hypothetical protein
MGWGKGISTDLGARGGPAEGDPIKGSGKPESQACDTTEGARRECEAARPLQDRGGERSEAGP